jgi:hypothetical protein
VLEAAVSGAQDLDHCVDVIALRGAAAALDPAAGATVHEHMSPAFEENVDRLHEASALGSTIAWVDVDVQRVQALRAVVRPAVTAVGCPAVLAAEVLDATSEGHDTILPLSAVTRWRTLVRGGGRG